MATKKCQVKDCKNFLGPEGATVGYEIDGQSYELKVCELHAHMARAGGFNITKDREFKPVPAKFFIKKGFK